MRGAGPPPDSLRRQLALHLRRLKDEGVWGLEVGTAAPPQPHPSAATDRQTAPPWRGSDAGGPVAGAPVVPSQGELFGVADEAAGAGSPPSLEALGAEASACVRCRLHRSRTQVVFGTGDPRARLMFIGEAPGRDEDLQGEPFVGRAGQLLTRIIEAMGLRREEVYIANVIKCRPPNNRNPQADEIDSCLPYLMGQIAAIRPRVVVLLGRVAVQAVLGTSAPMSQLRGQLRQWRGIQVMCTFHPAYLLRNPGAKRQVWEDMKRVRDALAAGGG